MCAFCTGQPLCAQHLHHQTGRCQDFLFFQPAASALPSPALVACRALAALQVRIYLVRLCNSPEEKRQYNEAVKVGRGGLAGLGATPAARGVLKTNLLLQAAFAAWSRKVLQTEMLMSPQKSTLTASGE